MSEKILVSDRFTSNQLYRGAHFCVIKNLRPTDRWIKKIVKMHFRIKAFDNKNLIAESGNYMPYKSIKE